LREAGEGRSAGTRSGTYERQKYAGTNAQKLTERTKQQNETNSCTFRGVSVASTSAAGAALVFLALDRCGSLSKGSLLLKFTTFELRGEFSWFAVLELGSFRL
jgi:hypothetical protein